MGEVLQQVKSCACGCGLYPKSQKSRYVAGHNRSSAAFQFIVDKSSGCWVWQLSKDSSGYGLTTRNKVMVRAHVIYFKWFYGHSQTMFIDHVCLNKSCVNPEHLRDVTRNDNQRNVKVYRNNKTGFKGVYPSGRRKPYQVTIRINKKTTSIGTFLSAVEAAKAYDDAVRRLVKTRPIRVNFPKGDLELPAR